MYRKMEQTLHGSCASIQPPFSAYRTGLKGKQSAPFERALNNVLETTYTDLPFTFYLTMISAFEGSGITVEPERIVPYKP
jgi:hypothetical protein